MVKMHILLEVLMVLVVACLMVTSSDQAAAETNHSPVNHPNRRQRRTVAPNAYLQALVNALQDGQEGDDQEIISTDLAAQFTPSTPSPQNINCYFEETRKVLRGGRCVQFGGLGGRHSRNRPWMCQAGVDLAMSPDCPARRRSSRNQRG